MAKSLQAREHEKAVLTAQLNHALQFEQHRASTDQLTGLRNHRYFQEALAAELYRCSRTGELTTIAVLDLDDFKAVNDTFGHSEGDAVLQRTAAVLTQALRPYDLPARLGGEEFAVLLPGLELNGALAVGERLRCAVQVSPTEVDGFGVPAITVSIGAAQMREDDRLDDLMNRADIALFRAKESGKNRCSP